MEDLVTVKGKIGSTTHNFYLPRSATLLELKHAIEKSSGISPNCQKICVTGKILTSDHENELITKLGLKHNSSILIVKQEESITNKLKVEEVITTLNLENQAGTPTCHITSKLKNQSNGDSITIDTTITPSIINELNRSTYSSSTNNCSTFSRWMGDLEKHISHLNLFDLVIPGTHNSGSYSINAHSEFSSDAPAYLNSLPLGFATMIKPISISWSICQQKSIYEQLEGGIRFLDMRISYNNITQKIHVCHGLFGCEVDIILDDINKFITTNSKEIVIISFSHLHNFDVERHAQFIELIVAKLGKDKLIEERSQDDQYFKLSNLWKFKKQIIVGYHSDFAPSFFWKSKGQFNSPWPNTPNPKLLQSSLTSILTQYKRETNRPHVLQGIITPDINCIMNGLFSPYSPKNLFDLVVNSSKEVVEYIKELTKQKQFKLNVVTVDFFHLTNLVETAIEINKTII